MKIKSWHWGVGFLSILFLLSLGSETLSGFAFDHQDTDSILLAPNGQHWFGTDSLGRDVFTRVFYGARVSLFVAIFSSALTMLLGISLGALAGWLGGFTERLLIRTLDVLQAIPSFLLVSLLCLVLHNWLEVV